MKYFLLFLLSSLFVQTQSEKDSLHQVWNDLSFNDTIRMRAMHRLIESHYSYQNPDSALALSESLLAKAKELKFRKMEAVAHLQMASTIAYTRNHLENAILHGKEALAILLEEGDSLLLERAYFNIGTSYYFNRDMINAYAYARKALAVAEVVAPNSEKYYGSLVMLGNIFSALENYKKSEQYFVRALAGCNEENPKAECYILYGNLGNTYIGNGDTIKGLEFYKKSAEVKELNRHSYGYALLNLASLLGEMQEYDQADFYVQELKILATELQSNLFLAGYYCYGAPIKSHRGADEEALADLAKSLSIFKAMGVAEGEEDVYTFQYRIHRKLKRYAEALFDDDEIKRIQKEANFGGRSIEIQRKEFQSQILADSMKVVDEKREIEYQHMAAIRKKERTSNIAFGVGALVLLLSGGLYSRLQFVRKSKATIEKEKERSDTLLLNILPAEIAEELKEKGRADARGYDLVSILFTDFKGFTELSSTLSATDLVAEINQCFEAFDLIMDKFHIEKIKTIGDAYMAAGGLPIPSKDSVRNTVLAALEMQDFISERKRKMDQQQLPAFEMRVGVHTGPVVAGIVGIKKVSIRYLGRYRKYSLKNGKQWSC